MRLRTFLVRLGTLLTDKPPRRSARAIPLLPRNPHGDLAIVEGGSTAEGIHLGAVAGSIDLVQHGYSSRSVRDGALRFDPCLPHRLKRAAFRLRFRQAWLNISMSQAEVTVEVAADARREIAVCVRDEMRSVRPGEATSSPF